MIKGGYIINFMRKCISLTPLERKVYNFNILDIEAEPVFHSFIAHGNHNLCHI